MLCSGGVYMTLAYDRMKVGILGLTKGAGAGFVAACLARAYASERRLRPAVLELGQGGLYDSLGLARHFAGDGFVSFHDEAARDKKLRGRGNIRFDVNWVLDTGGRLAELDAYKRLRLLANCRGDVILVSLSGLAGAELEKLLPEMDVVLLVVDPLPSQLIAGHELLCRLRAHDWPVVYLINKMNPGVNVREVYRYLNIAPALHLPLVPLEQIYAAEYACRVVCDLEPARGLLRKPLNAVITMIEKTAGIE
jgi:hypothetical protein